MAMLVYRSVNAACLPAKTHGRTWPRAETWFHTQSKSWSFSLRISDEGPEITSILYTSKAFSGSALNIFKFMSLYIDSIHQRYPKLAGWQVMFQHPEVRQGPPEKKKNLQRHMHRGYIESPLYSFAKMVIPWYPMGDSWCLLRFIEMLALSKWTMSWQVSVISDCSRS